MLLSLKQLLNFSLYGTDGPLGRVDDFYFEDSTWAVRYIVAKTGTWITHDYALVSPLSIVKDFDLHNQSIELDLDKQIIKQAPPADLIKPISEQFERKFFKFYKKRPYWEGEGLWADSDQLSDIRGKISFEADPNQKRNSNLRSTKEVLNYEIQSNDGNIGYINDFILDDSNWKIRYLVVDTHKWLPEKLVTIPPNWCQTIDWLNRKVVFDASKKEIKGAPSFNPNQPINRSYETKVYDYFCRPVYWKGSTHPKDN